MKKLISLHTIMNKTTGLLLFLLPLTLHFIELKYSSVVVCSIATFSAMQEGYYIGTGREIVHSKKEEDWNRQRKYCLDNIKNAVFPHVIRIVSGM